MANCYAYQDPQFQPSMRLISSITKAFPAVVTTTFDHDYVSGTIVRFSLPACVGMFQLDKRTAIITVTGTDTFTIDIDTTNFDTFAIPGAPAWYENPCALVIPIGEVSSQLSAAVQDVT